MIRQTFLFDTNILVDYCCPERSGYKTARRIVDICLECGHKLLVTSGALRDCYYLMCVNEKSCLRASGEPVNQETAAAVECMAAGYIERITEIANVVPTDYNSARLALKLRNKHADFEDNLVIVAAQRVGDCTLVTNDQKLLRHFPADCISSEDACKMLLSA